MDNKDEMKEFKDHVNKATLEIVFKGIRPEWISYKDFKELRKELKRNSDIYRKGIRSKDLSKLPKSFIKRMKALELAEKAAKKSEEVEESTNGIDNDIKVVETLKL